MKRILVTGANGFVGRHVVDRLLAHGLRVTAAVRSFAGLAEVRRGAVPLLLGDICGLTPATAVPCFRGHDTIVHLASMVHVAAGKAADDDQRFHEVNVEGTLRVAECAARAGARRMVLVSSIHAMATHSAQRLTPSSPCHPNTPYGRSKLEAERQLQQRGSELDLEIVIVRPTPVYGPGHFGNLKLLFSTVERGWPLPIGCLRSERSLVYVVNLADALVRCATDGRAAGHTFLVSDGEPVTLPHLAGLIGAALNKRPRIVPVPSSALWLAGRMSGQGRLVDRLLASLAVDDPTLAQTLDWHPPYSMATGIEMTLHQPSGTPNARLAA